MIVRNQRTTDTATHSSEARTRKKAAVLTVPIGMWKEGMFCIELPEIMMDPDGLVPKVWSATEAGAKKLAKEAIKKHRDLIKHMTPRQISKLSWQRRLQESQNRSGQ